MNIWFLYLLIAFLVFLILWSVRSKKRGSGSMPVYWPRNCYSCEHYREYRSPDKLNPDKTVTPGKVENRYCNMGRFHLTDLQSCPMYKERTYGTKPSLYVPPPPPIPPRK